MQCKNGGWGSFDKDNTKMIFQYIPFADHNAMLDPPTVDITGRILEMLATYGYTRKDKRVEKAIEFIFSEQEPDGSWFGRWGVNYLYGTFLVLRGLEAIGVGSPRAADSAGGGVDSHGAERRRRLGRELRQLRRSRHARRWPQHAVADRVGHPGPAGGGRRPLRLGCQGRALAAERQQPDGSWDESMGEGPTRQACITGTGFPRVFYLAYTIYRQLFSRCWRLTDYQPGDGKQPQLTAAGGLTETMAVPISQMWTVASYVLKKRLDGQKALSAGAHAGAAVPLQPGVRRLRQGAVSAAHSQEASLAGRMLSRGRRVRRAHGVDSRRRAAAAPADRRDRRTASSRARSTSTCAPMRLNSSDGCRSSRRPSI